MRQNGIQHIKVAPYHPAFNGLIALAAQTFKAGVKRMIVGTLEDLINRFVCITNNTKHHHESISGQTLDGTETQDSPGRGQARVRGTDDRQARQKEGHDQTARDRVLQEGGTIFA